MPKWFLCCLAIVYGSFDGTVARAADAEGKRPNIVLIVADDLGYADLGAQGISTDVRTPHLDSLASNGARFTHAYVSAPLCSPSRAGLITGRYQQRFGYEFNPGGVNHPNFGLPLGETTLADVLRQAGYRTGALGKWHLGNRKELAPTARGFDDFYGFWGGAHDYVNHAKHKGMNTIRRGDKPLPEKEYLTDAIGREAADFIDRHHAKPFFLYVAFNAVHQPMQAPEKYLEPFQQVQDRKRRLMLGMLAAMDEAVGQLLGKLREHQIDQNTLIFFISDNGGPTAGNASLNTPLRGYKAELLEGGIRVPFLVQWKGRIPAGQVIDQPVIALDIFPTATAATAAAATAAAAAGDAAAPKERPIDGVNLLPWLELKQTGPIHDRLFWRYWPHWAVREGDWKALGRRDRVQLFNLAQDPAETHDLAGEHPEIVDRLKQSFDRWNKELAEPLWLDPNHERQTREFDQAAATQPANAAPHKGVETPAEHP